ncbi:kinase non-catalytic C-lobe domain-containing protein 1-like [Betta splendens]|uniref:Kinase non-catalytic C-lobe domain-containing protein 1-like n=1 Tax=Betta splendens TaxID=158456 RepID=A0A6P7KQZ9_BETSP|nr:kinase non-catalytic C-lobe domain-containing protein 1-like [Betta splendens]
MGTLLHEQLSDDPEGSFVPPEFDNTGSTFEGHVYSLGSTLSAALTFVIEPELEAELGEEMQKLLEQMQEENPENRPLLQDILSLAAARLSNTSSTAVCRKLSSVGRRVLSIESVSNAQDGQACSWEARWQHPKPRRPAKRLSSDDGSNRVRGDSPVRANGLSRQQLCGAWDSSLWAEDLVGGGGDGMILADEMDFTSHGSSPVRRRTQQRLNRVRGALNRSCSVPDSNNPPSTPPPTHGDISVPVSDLTEIGADEHSGAWSDRFQRLDRGWSCDSYPRSSSEGYGSASAENQATQVEYDPAETSCSEEANIELGAENGSEHCVQDLVSSCASCQDLEAKQDSSEDQSPLNHSLYIPNNHMTKSMLCLNEESQDEWISLRDLLARCGRRLMINELWALCYTCLSSLQTYIDFPAYLCLDTVYVGCEGEVIFLKPKRLGSREDFFLAPEYQEHRIVTEKVCVYGVAAILWAAAKFGLSPNQKLAMPRKLKRLLLEMAKRTPIERPTIVAAKKSCRDYLSHQGTSAETVWNDLIGRVHPPASKCSDAEDLRAVETPPSLCEKPPVNSGFVPMATESRLAPVPGPVPHSYPVSRDAQLPDAFTSTSTHFSPIVLTSEAGESHNIGAVIDGTLDEFLKSCDHKEGLDLHYTPASKQTYPSQPDPDLHLHAQKSPVHQTVVATVSSSASTFPDVSHLEVSLSQPLSFNLNGCSVFNNYLFRQNPSTGRLSLVPVQVRAPDFLPGLDINVSLIPQPLQELITAGQSTGGARMNSLNEPRDCSPPLSPFSDRKHSVSEAPEGGTNHNLTQRLSRSSPVCVSSKVLPALQEVIDLLKGEFSLSGCLENKQEDISMGEYIFSLKDLDHRTFARVVKERFSHLYWEEDLLGVLHCLVNHSPSTLAPYCASDEQPPSKAAERATPTPPLVAGACRGRGGDRLRGRLDLNGNVHASSPAAEEPWEGSEARSDPGGDEAAPEEVELRSERSDHCIGHGVSTDGSDAGVVEGGDRSAGGGHQSPSEAGCPWGREEGLTGAGAQQMSPDCSEDMEDGDALASERLLSPGTRAEGPGLGLGPAWALAFYGEECFGPEVVQYSVNLGQHTGSPCLEVKAQELQQQLIIETRNLRKTRNFYQKLIQQERKHKGSENRLMVSKLKSQLDELRSKVLFLDSVRRYLEILSVEQWGLEASLLPRLAVCGSRDLRASEDPSVLSFGTSRGRSAVQAGSPLGLMAHLYARNAAIEGYIQQFLYTYRFFCSPEQLLQFIMERFITSAREGADMSADSEKIFHRSLDLLCFWITDCKSVDFPPKSRLTELLENFLTTEVIPVDARGDKLLAALHSPLRCVWSEEQSESACLHSSPEELGRKWRISKVVEPPVSVHKDKAFSVAAALPVPCYGSLLGDLHSEERRPFSQHEASSQHVAQQLTLLQQEMFQGCHPVHFLNSRVRGIGDKVSTLNNRNVSCHILPAGGSSGLGCEGTPSDSSLQQLLTYAESVTNWISTEIIICDSIKAQVALLTKYLWIGKHCYESRNFATAMQVLGGLDNGIVRQLPAWKHLSSKVCEILQELRAVQVFLKSDDLCLMGAEPAPRRPTLPSAHILAMHVQQLEIGAFTFTTGAYKWTKLRRIAKVVSQVHAFQEASFAHGPDRDLQAYLRRRIGRLAAADLRLSVADGDAAFQLTGERPARRIQDALRRVRANFQ